MALFPVLMVSVDAGQGCCAINKHIVLCFLLVHKIADVLSFSEIILRPNLEPCRLKTPNYSFRYIYPYHVRPFDDVLSRDQPYQFNHGCDFILWTTICVH